VTRKKTTTGTMGSKRKADTKKERAEAASSGGAARAAKAVAPKEQHKADEVIAEVAIALLEAHPTLPDKDYILESFASFYRDAAERAAAAAAAPVPEPAPEPEPEPKPKRRASLTMDVASRPRPVSSPSVAPLAAVAPAAPAAVPVAQVLEVEEAQPVEILEYEEDAGGIDALLAEAEGASEASAESDDLFALLAKEAEGKVDDDFDFSFQTAADQSSPFFVAPAAPVVDEGATVVVEGLEAAVVDPFAGTPISQEALEADWQPSSAGPSGREADWQPSSAGPSGIEADWQPGAAVDAEEAVIEAEEAVGEQPDAEAPVALVEPSESTTLIQAMPDDEPADSGASAPQGRKSRKASKERRG